MKTFSEFRVNDTFHSTCSISDKELEEYLKFSRVRNAFLEDKRKGEQQLVSGRPSYSEKQKFVNYFQGIWICLFVFA